MTFNSNSSENELLHLENTGSTDKTMIHAIGSIANSTGLEIEAGAMGVQANIYNPSSYVNTYDFYGATEGGDDSWNVAAYLTALGGDYSSNYGVYAYTYGYSGSNSIAIYGTAGGEGTNYAGFFDGDVEITGTCYCTLADEMLQENSHALKGGLAKIMALKPKTYEMKADEFKDRIALGKGRQFGLVAQDVQSVLPELVHEAIAPPHLTRDEIKKKTKKQGFKYRALNYTGLIPVLVEAIQEQNTRIDSLDAEIMRLKAGR